MYEIEIETETQIRLDNIAELCGLERLKGETDNSLRKKIWLRMYNCRCTAPFETKVDFEFIPKEINPQKELYKNVESKEDSLRPSLSDSCGENLQRGYILDDLQS
jgi:hypothetical protein